MRGRDWGVLSNFEYGKRLLNDGPDVPQSDNPKTVNGGGGVGLGLCE